MTDSLLPPGIKIGSGRDLEDRGVVRVDLSADLGNSSLPIPAPKIGASLVITPRQARALGAVLIKQADLVEQGERARNPYPRLVQG